MKRRRSRREYRQSVEFFDDEERLDVWQTLSRFLLLIVFLLVMAGILSMFWPEIQRQRDIEAEIERLTAKRDSLLSKKKALTGQVEWMRSDPEYLEMIARDRLDLQKDGEHIFRIRREDGPAGN